MALWHPWCPLCHPICPVPCPILRILGSPVALPSDSWASPEPGFVPGVRVSSHLCWDSCPVSHEQPPVLGLVSGVLGSWPGCRASLAAGSGGCGLSLGRGCRQEGRVRDGEIWCRRWLACGRKWHCCPRVTSVPAGAIWCQHSGYVMGQGVLRGDPGCALGAFWGDPGCTMGLGAPWGALSPCAPG